MLNMVLKILSSYDDKTFDTYIEYYARTIFESYGFDVFGINLSANGIDFIIVGKRRIMKIRVKYILMETGCVFMRAKDFDIRDQALYLCLLVFDRNGLPEIYVIRSTEWIHSNEVLRYHRFPVRRYGVEINDQNAYLLKQYRIEKVFDI